MDIPSDGLSRRERERLSRKRAILDAAEDVFAERNFSNATIEEIAQRAEFGKGTLYNYFPEGKEEILRGVFDRLYNDLRTLIKESFGEQRHVRFRESMERFFKRSFEFFLTRRSLFLILVKESQRLSLSDNEERADYFRKQHAMALETLAAPLEAAMQRGELKHLPPLLLAHMLFVNLKGGQLRQCIHQPDEPGSELQMTSDEMASFLTDLLLFGAANPEAAITTAETAVSVPSSAA